MIFASPPIMLSASAMLPRRRPKFSRASWGSMKLMFTDAPGPQDVVAERPGTS